LGGQQQLSAATDDVLNSLESTALVFNSVQSNAHILVEQINAYDAQGQILKERCDPKAQGPIDQLLAEIQQIRGVAQNLINTSQPIAASFQDTRNKMAGYPVQKYVHIFAYISIALIAVACVVGVLGAFLKSPCLLTIAAIFGVLMLLQVLVLISVELTANLALADFCIHDPLNETVAIVQDGFAFNVTNSVEYFLSCQGQNPLSESVDQANSQLLQIQQMVHALAPEVPLACTHHPSEAKQAIEHIETILVQSNHTLETIELSISCNTTNTILQAILVEGVCTNLFNGVFSFWTTQCAASFCLLLSLFFSTYVQRSWKTARRSNREEHQELANPTDSDPFAQMNDPLLPPTAMAVDPFGDSNSLNGNGAGAVSTTSVPWAGAVESTGCTGPPLPTASPWAPAGLEESMKA
jgi:hypothetical protein